MKLFFSLYQYRMNNKHVAPGKKESIVAGFSLTAKHADMESYEEAKLIHESN